MATAKKIIPMMHRRAFTKKLIGGSALASLGLSSAWAAPAQAEAKVSGAAPEISDAVPHAAVLRRLRGPMASITIPYSRDYSIDRGALRAWVDFVCSDKAPVLFLTHGDSELYNLSEAEIETVIRTVADAARGRALVLGGTGQWWTGRLIRFINRLADSGVDAINVHLSNSVHDDEDIFGAFRQINDEAKLPVLSSDGNWSVDLIRRLAKLPNMIGDKCHSELYKYHDFIRAGREDHFAVLGAGQMRHFLFGYLIGSPAYLCPLAPIAPQISHSFYTALTEGDLDEARRIMFHYEDHLLKITIPIGYPQMYKSALYLSGHYATNLMRPPRRSNGPAELAKMRECLEYFNLPVKRKA